MQPSHITDGVEIPDHDPLAAYLLQAGGPVEIAGLAIDSPALDELRQQGMVLVVPLISQGELLGTMNLGPRLSDQAYSSDDRRLLSSLASQVAPSVKVANLVRAQEAEAQRRERMEQELRVAALIQQTLLPRSLPDPEGWEISAYYRPAREVGGDFYDFVSLDGGRLGFVIGDVTDKGVPAALVMATTRSHLRAAALRSGDPGRVLADVNDILVEEIPPAMFVTCMYGVIETATGKVTFANAGHNLPYVRSDDGVVEVRATGMPLGLMPGMSYEVQDHHLAPGAVMLLSSDGIVEAHASSGEMYGFDRVRAAIALTDPRSAIDGLLGDFSAFIGSAEEQEDDITLVSIRRTSGAAEESAGLFGSAVAGFVVPSAEGNERLIMDRVAAIVEGAVTGPRLDRLKTAVAEAAMNAIEHGNHGNPELDVTVEVETTPAAVTVRITDLGGGADRDPADRPDLDAKLAGLQTPRGWGLFLISSMVDEVRSIVEQGLHTLEVVMYREGDPS